MPQVKPMRDACGPRCRACASNPLRGFAPSGFHRYRKSGDRQHPQDRAFVQAANASFAAILGNCLSKYRAVVAPHRRSLNFQRAGPAQHKMLGDKQVQRGNSQKAQFPEQMEFA